MRSTIRRVAATPPPVKMIADANTLDIMRFVGAKMGIRVKVLAKAGEKYSSSGGENVLIVPRDNAHVMVNAPGNSIKEFWTKYSQEKSRRKLIWVAAQAASVRVHQ